MRTEPARRRARPPLSPANRPGGRQGSRSCSDRRFEPRETENEPACYCCRLPTPQGHLMAETRTPVVPETPPTTDPSLRAVAMPADTNPAWRHFRRLAAVPDGPGGHYRRHTASQRQSCHGSHHRHDVSPPGHGRRRGELPLQHRKNRQHVDHGQDRKLGAARRRRRPRSRSPRASSPMSASTPTGVRNRSRTQPL